MAFFSGTDLSTLREEGNERNCFVSLIVNNEGSYCAAITRKLQAKIEVTTKSLGQTYEFFGDGPVTNGAMTTTKTDVIDKEVIQYFMLDIEKEEVTNPLSYLDTRFDEIEQKKMAVKKEAEKSNLFLNNINRNTRIPDEDQEFFDWIHNKKEESKELTVFDEKTMKDMEVWSPNPTIIHYLVAQLVTCSLIINNDIDLKQWITRHMQKKYAEIFCEDDTKFDSWADFLVEFIVYRYNDNNVPDELLCENFEHYIWLVAEAMIEELQKYPSNKYINKYIEYLSLYETPEYE